MLIDGQDELSMQLLNDVNLIERLVDWAQKTPDMVGVNSEASRLLAWLVKNAYRLRDNSTPSNDSLQKLISVPGAIDVLVKMLGAAHVVMQNEAIIALTIITTSQNNEHFIKILIDVNLADSIVDFIQRVAETERITNEIIDNLRTLITVLKKSEQMEKYLNEKNVDEKSIPRVKELATL